MTEADVKNVGYHKAASRKAFHSFDNRNTGRLTLAQDVQLHPLSCGHVFTHSHQRQKLHLEEEITKNYEVQLPDFPGLWQR